MLCIAETTNPDVCYLAFQFNSSRCVSRPSSLCLLYLLWSLYSTIQVIFMFVCDRTRETERARERVRCRHRFRFCYSLLGFYYQNRFRRIWFLLSYCCKCDWIQLNCVLFVDVIVVVWCLMSYFNDEFNLYMLCVCVCVRVKNATHLFGIQFAKNSSSKMLFASLPPHNLPISPLQRAFAFISAPFSILCCLSRASALPWLEFVGSLTQNTTPSTVTL